VITLRDKPEFFNTVDCIVSYFYEAGYNTSKYDTSEALLHAQVAILADIYDCTSLYRLAKKSFAKSVQAAKSNEWREIAAFVYDFTTTEAPAHKEIRHIVINTVSSRWYMLKSTLHNETVVSLLRSNADLATDLLLGRRYGSIKKDVGEYHLTAFVRIVRKRVGEECLIARGNSSCRQPFLVRYVTYSTPIL
jgi:hypothetical protein